jgi:hypothetical protein
VVIREQAIEIAKQELTAHGFALPDYDITLDAENPDENDWMVWLEKKGAFPVPGGRHAVRVNKTTGAAQFMPGE